MPVSQTITDALAKLQDDADNLAGLKASAAHANAELAEAMHTAEVASNAVTAATGQLAADRESLTALIASTYAADAIAPTPPTIAIEPMTPAEPEVPPVLPTPDGIAGPQITPPAPIGSDGVPA